jgi:hypothetical protein
VRRLQRVEDVPRSLFWVPEESWPFMKLDDLYQEVILDHARKPRNFGVLGEAWKTLRKECPCQTSECDKKYWAYYVINGASFGTIFTTKYHINNWSAENIYGPYELNGDLLNYINSL